MGDYEWPDYVIVRDIEGDVRAQVTNHPISRLDFFAGLAMQALVMRHGSTLTGLIVEQSINMARFIMAKLDEEAHND
jgi:hypothetical protein